MAAVPNNPLNSADLQTLFLPVAEEQARAFEENPAIISQFDAYARASMFVLLAHGRKEQVDLNLAQRMLVDFVPIVGNSNASALADFVEQARGTSDIIGLCSKAKEVGFRFLSPSEIEKKPFLKMGAWDWEFQAAHATPFSERHIAGKRVWASSEQHRILTAVVAEPEEDMNIEGFAGTGKTHLIAYIGTHCPDRFTYIAPRGSQLDALVARVGAGGLRTSTLHQLSTAMAGLYARESGEDVRYRPNDFMTPAELVTFHNIQSVGEYAPTKVVAVCIQAIRRFCHSIDTVILDKHFFRDVPITFTHQDMAALRAYANVLWDFTIQRPDTQRRVARLDYHVVKYLDLQERPVPEWFGSLIVDEAHDLSAPWRRILARSEKGVLRLGDRYQYLGLGGTEDQAHGRQRSLVRSVRMGDNASELVNEVLLTHPAMPQQAFVGSRERHTKIRKYDDHSLGFVREGLVLFGEVWGLLGYLQRCAHRGERFRVLDASVKALEQVVSDLADLYAHDERPMYFSLRRFGSWGEFTNAHVRESAVKPIISLIERGYARPNLVATLGKQNTKGVDGGITMGLAADGKNLEQSTVVLAPDLFPDDVSEGRSTAAKTTGSIYLALSRARDELWIPGFAKDWLTDFRQASRRRR